MPLVPIFYWRGYGDYFLCLSTSKITPAQRMAINQNNNTAASLAFSGTLLGYDPLIQCGNQCGEYSRLFRLGRDCTGDSVTRFAGVRLYMPALSEKIINHNTAAGMFMGTAALAGGILTQLV